jgi:hypothetical protein
LTNSGQGYLLNEDNTKLMQHYNAEIINEVKFLRKLGKTYHEIKTILKMHIPKATMATWCRGIPMDQKYYDKVYKLNTDRLSIARNKAIEANRVKRCKFLEELKVKNFPIASQVCQFETAKIALSMLCLGEASKYKTGSGHFCLGNSNPKIIQLFLELLKKTYDYNPEKVRCTVQCRADQNTEVLETYWQEVTGIPKQKFYKSRIDKRTIGIPTLRSDYYGVLKVDYLNTKVQLDLECLAELVYNEVINGPKV